jgi:hypothetical protein
MTPATMVATAILLGAFVATAGVYGLLYCLSHSHGRSAAKMGRLLSCGALCAIAAAIVLFTPLHPAWKLLIAGSCAGYLTIPPIAWRHLDRLHRGRT